MYSWTFGCQQQNNCLANDYPRTYNDYPSTYNVDSIIIPVACVFGITIVFIVVFIICRRCNLAKPSTQTIVPPIQKFDFEMTQQPSTANPTLEPIPTPEPNPTIALEEEGIIQQGTHTPGEQGGVYQK